MQKASIRPNYYSSPPQEQQLIRHVKVTSKNIPANSFDHAEIVFDGVEHTDVSFEALLYFNNPDANYRTGRTEESGYVGSFDIFGHGRCFGAVGHCKVRSREPRYGDYREEHPLTPLQKRVVVTQGLKQMLKGAGKKLHCIKIVPIVRKPGKKYKQDGSDLLKFSRMTLKTRKSK